MVTLPMSAHLIAIFKINSFSAGVMFAEFVLKSVAPSLMPLSVEPARPELSLSAAPVDDPFLIWTIFDAFFSIDGFRVPPGVVGGGADGPGEPLSAASVL